MSVHSEKESASPGSTIEEAVADDSGSAAKLEGWRLIVVEIWLFCSEPPPNAS